MNTYYNPVRTYQGVGSLNTLPELVHKVLPNKSHLLLLLVKEDLQDNPNVQSIRKEWEGYVTVEYFPYSNPDIEQLYELYVRTKELKVSLIIAMGGGSTLDVGKSLCCLYGVEINSVEELRTFIMEKRYTEPACPWIGVPTTAGTGSEVTCWATIWDLKKSLKHSIDTVHNYAYAAILDTELLYTMPISLAVSSALDAMAHAVESYWSKAANTISKVMSLSAIELIMAYIDQLIEDSQSRVAYNFIAQGSLLAGLAFSNTRTTACHSISYPLTMHYQIPHGVAVSLLLAPVFEFNKVVISDIQPLLHAFGVGNPKELGMRITNILSRAGLYTTLGDWGAMESDIPELVTQSITKGRADNNPRELTQEGITEILQRIF